MIMMDLHFLHPARERKTSEECEAEWVGLERRRRGARGVPAARGCGVVESMKWPRERTNIDEENTKTGVNGGAASRRGEKVRGKNTCPEKRNSFNR